MSGVNKMVARVAECWKYRKTESQKYVGQIVHVIGKGNGTLICKCKDGSTVVFAKEEIKIRSSELRSGATILNSYSGKVYYHQLSDTDPIDMQLWTITAGYWALIQVESYVKDQDRYILHCRFLRCIKYRHDLRISYIQRIVFKNTDDYITNLYWGPGV